jgi:steroid 5-alpha reductase family enzyme
MSVFLLLALLAGFLWLTMASVWLFQRRTGNPGWIDVFWTFGTGLACVAAALAPVDGMAAFWPRQALVAALAAIWMLRLGVTLGIRVGTTPEDARYIQFRKEWGADFQSRLFFFVQNQAFGSVLFPLAALVAAHHPAPGWRLADGIGALILLVAIVGEGIADRQLVRFKADPANHGRICDSGLWAWSRHPNYLFEWLGWFAYPAIAIDLGYPWGFLALAGPALMYYVLVHYTGLPPLEAHMLRSRGDAFRAYQARTAILVPGFRGWRRFGFPRDR